MSDLALLLPELYLAATAAGLIIGESAHHGERLRLIFPTALLGIGGAAIQTLLSYRNGPAQYLGGALAHDGLSVFFKLLFLALAAGLVGLACLGDEVEEESRAEFCSISIAGVIALMIAAASSNLFVGAIALQGAGLVGYLLAGFGRGRLAATEAAAKWLLFSGVSGALLLLSATALYLHTGSMNIYEIHRSLVATPLQPQAILAVFAALFIGLSAPMLVFPSQLWGLDSLQGAPSPAGAYLLAGLRAGAFAIAARVIVAVFSQPALFPGKWQPLGGWDWTEWLALCAGLTLLLPALLSARQRNANRLAACVGVLQGGFLLLGLLVLEEVGLAALLFNLLVDLVSVVGFYYLLSLSVSRRGTAESLGLRGVLRKRPGEAIALVCFAASWVGVPPFAGSIGKFALISAAARREWYVLCGLALVAMTLTVIAVGRLLLELLDPSAETEVERGALSLARERKLFVIALVFPLIASAVFSEALLRWASLSLQFIFW